VSPGSLAVRNIPVPVSLLLCAWILCVAGVFYFKGRTFNPEVWLNFVHLMSHLPGVLAGGLLWNSFLCLGMWFLFYGLGDSILTLSRLGGMTRLERGVVAAGLGSGTFSVLLLLLGLAGLWSDAILRSVFFAGIFLSTSSVVYRKLFNASRVDIVNAPSTKGESLGSLQLVAVGIVTLAVLMNILASAAPEIFYDALLYHLALPKLYLLRGGIFPTPENLYSGIPFNVEMLYGFALAISSDGLPALLHFSFGLWTTLAIWAWMRRRASRSAGILAVLLFYLCPLILLGSWQSGIDLGGGFYVFVAFVALSFNLDSSGTANSKAWAALAGSLIGFACGVKYTLLPFGLFFLLIHFWLRPRTGGSRRETLVMASALGVVFFPWLLKNLWFYGNPVYPFFSRLFGSSEPALFVSFLQDARSRDLVHTFSTIAGWKSFFAHPWGITVGNRSSDDWLGANWLILIPWLLFLRWGIWRKLQNVPPALTALVTLGFLGYSLWYLTSDIVRFVIPSLTFIACGIALAVESVRSPIWLRKMGWVGAIFFSLFNFQTISRLGETWAMGRWEVLSGRQSPGDYLKKEHMSYGAPYYKAMEYVRAELPEKAKILFLGESRAFYCERDFIAASVFDENPLWAEAGKAKTAGELYSKVKEMGVTHVFLSATQLYTYSHMPTVMPLDVVGGDVFRDFVGSHLRVVFEEKEFNDSGHTNLWLIVYEVVSEAADDVAPKWKPFRILLENVARK
jgi:hypothetical protein